MNKGAEKSNLPIMLSTDYKAEKKGWCSHRLYVKDGQKIVTSSRLVKSYFETSTCTS